MKKKLALLLIWGFLLNVSPAFAGGALVVKNGKPITYGTRSLTYRYDQGSLGKLSNSETINIIEALFASWIGLGTSDVKFQKDSPSSIGLDVTEKNFDSILNSKNLLGYTPVIFDTDGKLLDSFLGSGAGNSVLGLAGPITVSSGQFANQIAESQGVFNGKFIDGINTGSNPESSEDSLKGTILHEFGHAFGLDHSQINVESIKSSSSQEIRDSVPLMFPIAVNDLFLIRRDDESAASLLYPNSTSAASYGKIEGKLFRADGITPVLGGNIIARNINDPTLEAISCVSDYLSNNTGSYTLSAVPPGSYRIEIEPIDLSFTGGSGVGPYTNSKSDKSFQDPVPKGFYTGPNQPIVTDQSQALIVNVSEGQTISEANIIASTTASSTTSSSGSTSNSTEVEPNDSVSTAQSLTLPTIITGSINSTDSGELELTSDTGSMIIISDLFKVILTESTNLNALLTIDSTSQDDDLDLVLFNADGSLILDSSSQSGNVDELISKTLSAGSYLLGIGAFSGSSTYSLEVRKSSSSTNPSVLLTGENTITLSSAGMNSTVLTANASNFSSMNPCRVTSSDPTLLMIKKPLKFSLGPNRQRKSFKVKVPINSAFNIIDSQTSETVTVSITCNNGTSDELDVTLDGTLESKTTGKRHWRITKPE